MECIPRENMWLAVELIWDHFSFQQWIKCKSDHGTWGPQKTYFHAYIIIHYHGPMVFAVREAKAVFSLQSQGTKAEKCRS